MLQIGTEWICVQRVSYEPDRYLRYRSIQMQIKTFKVCIVPASREVVLKTNRILCLLDEAQYSFIRITIFKSEIKTD
jgi:hypothetical protein